MTSSQFFKSMTSVFQIYSWRHYDDVINFKLIFLKKLVNTTQHADCGVSVTFSLGVRFCPPRVKCVGKIARVK